MPLKLLLNWRLWAGLGVMAALAYAGHCLYSAGQDSIRVKWNEDRLAQAEARSKLIDEHRAQEQAWQDQLNQERRNAVQREITLRSEARDAFTASDELRLQAAALARRLATQDPGTASADAATSLGELLATCSNRYTELAEVCDRHVNDLKTLTGSWPIKRKVP